MRGNNGERGVHGALGKYSEGKGQEQSEVEKSLGDSMCPPKVKPLNHKGRKTDTELKEGYLGSTQNPIKILVVERN